MCWQLTWDPSLLLAEGKKEIITGSLDKTMTLWRMQASFIEPTAHLLSTTRGIVFDGILVVLFVNSMAVLLIGSSYYLQADDASHSCGIVEVVKLTPSGAPIFSLAVDGAAPVSPDERQQVCTPNILLVTPYKSFSSSTTELAAQPLL